MKLKRVIPPHNFLGLEKPFSSYNRSQFVILPIPYEATTTYGKGTKDGPRAIMAASQQVELYDEELDFEPYKVGIHTSPSLKLLVTDFRKAHRQIYMATKKILAANKFPILLGGEHSISLGAIRACKEGYPDLSVLQLDAHADLRNQYEGTKYSHACVMRRALGICSVVHMGIRSMDAEEVEFARKTGQWDRIHFVHQIPNPNDQIPTILNQLSSQVYITIDVDVFDPSIIPSTGAPEPGGLGFREVLKILRRVIRRKKVVGLDVVELAPIKNFHAPDFTVAKLVYKIIGYLVKTA